MSTSMASSRGTGVNTEYSLCLMIDGSDAILEGKVLTSVVKEALEGGVTMVHYREKLLGDSTMVTNAKELLELCHKHGTKLIINGRADIAHITGADGIHLDQESISIKDARKIVGDEVIIGVSCNTIAQALLAFHDGANYLFVGPIYDTANITKASDVIGVAGAREIVSTVGKMTQKSKRIPCVAVGGLSLTIIPLLQYKCDTSDGYLDGFAVGSAIMSAKSPKAAAKDLSRAVFGNPPWQTTLRVDSPEYVSRVGDILRKMNPIACSMVYVYPFVHIPNSLMANFVANVLIAAGVEPVITSAIEETPNLAKSIGGLVLDIGGSCKSGDLPHLITLMQAYNKAGRPVLLDPEGAGASQMRLNMVSELLNNGYIDIIKGNENEVLALSSTRDADSTIKVTGPVSSAKLVFSVAQRERCTVLMTGPTDYLSDGRRTYAIHNGVDNLGNMADSGAALGALMVAFAALEADRMRAVLAAVLFYEIAAEIAQENPMCQGPGNFVPCFIDALKQLSELCKEGEDWLVKAKVEQMFVV